MMHHYTRLPAMLTCIAFFMSLTATPSATPSLY
jgi:hypothetical protein